MNKSAQNGDRVKVHYTGKFENGEIFDSSENSDPLEFNLGKQEMIPGFEKAVLGMAIGEKKTVTLTPQDAYGEVNEELKLKIPRKEFPAEMEPKVGMPLQMSDGNGNIVPLVITEVKEELVSVDANHPLAGETLVFNIELVGYVE